MMPQFFISTKRFWILMILSIVFMFVFSVGMYGLWILGLIIYLLLHRRKKMSYKDMRESEPNIYMSPISGQVYKIDKNIELNGKLWTRLKLVVMHLNEWGLYLPFDCEVDNVQRFNGNSFFRYSDSMKKFSEEKNENSKITLKSKFGDICILSLVKCILGFSPDIWVEPGDRGRLSSCFGYFPTGRIVLMYVPSEYNVLVEENEKILAGESVLAGSIKG